MGFFSMLLTALALSSPYGHEPINPSVTDDPDTWNYYSVDSGVTGTPSMTMDAWDLPHIAYTKGGDIWYASRDAGSWEWQTELVHADGGAPCIALDTGSNPWIVYTVQDGLLEIAVRDDSSWLELPYSDFGRTMTAPMIAIDQDDSVHLAYMTYLGGDPYEFRYAVGDGLEWTKMEFANFDEDYMVYGHAMTLDGDGNPRITGISRWIDPSDYDNYFLKLYQRGGSPYSWQTSLVAAFYCRGTPAIAVNSDGVTSLAYAWLEISPGLRYQEFPGTPSLAWELGDKPSMDIDGSDVVHMAFRSGGTILYGWLDGSGWQLDCLPYASPYGVGLRLDNYDQPHIAFVNSSHLRYAWHGDETGIQEEASSGSDPLIGSISPVPTTASVTMALLPGLEGVIDIELYDLTGRRLRDHTTIVTEGTGSEVKLDLHGLPSGVYILVARSGQRMETARITLLGS